MTTSAVAMMRLMQGGRRTTHPESFEKRIDRLKAKIDAEDKTEIRVESTDSSWIEG